MYMENINIYTYVCINSNQNQRICYTLFLFQQKGPERLAVLMAHSTTTISNKTTTKKSYNPLALKKMSLCCAEKKKPN